jgi:TonB family protein
MFTSLWSTSPNPRRDGRRAWLLIASVMLHGAALATLAAAQAWRVEAITEPPPVDVFVVLPPLPDLAPQAPSPPGREAPPAPPRHPETPAPPTPPAPPVVQPDPAALAAPIPPPATVPQPADAPPPTTTGSGDRNATDATGADPYGTGNGPRAGGGDEPALPIGGPITRPQIVPGTKVLPRYTEQARQTHLQGTVVLQATIDTAGNVVGVQVVKALPLGLDQEAVKAVSQWKFTPALLRGRPVKVYFNLTVDFEIR